MAALTHPDWNHPNMDFLLDPSIDVKKPDPAFFTVYELIEPSVYAEACRIFGKDCVRQWIRNGKIQYTQSTQYNTPYNTQYNTSSTQYIEYMQYMQYVQYMQFTQYTEFTKFKFSELDTAEKRRKMYLQYIDFIKAYTAPPPTNVHPYFTIAEIEFNIDQIHNHVKSFLIPN